MHTCHAQIDKRLRTLAATGELLEVDGEGRTYKEIRLLARHYGMTTVAIARRLAEIIDEQHAEKDDPSNEATGPVIATHVGLRMHQYPTREHGGVVVPELERMLRNAQSLYDDERFEEVPTLRAIAVSAGAKEATVALWKDALRLTFRPPFRRGRR